MPLVFISDKLSSAATGRGFKSLSDSFFSLKPLFSLLFRQSNWRHKKRCHVLMTIILFAAGKLAESIYKTPDLWPCWLTTYLVTEAWKLSSLVLDASQTKKQALFETVQ